MRVRAQSVADMINSGVVTLLQHPVQLEALSTAPMLCPLPAAGLTFGNDHAAGDTEHATPAGHVAGMINLRMITLSAAPRTAEALGSLPMLHTLPLLRPVQA